MCTQLAANLFAQEKSKWWCPVWWSESHECSSRKCEKVYMSVFLNVQKF